MKNAPDRVLSIAEVARLLGCSTRTIRRLEQEGLVTIPRTGTLHRRFGLKQIRELAALRERDIKDPLGVVADPETMADVEVPAEGLGTFEAARLLQVSPWTIRRYVTSGLVQPKRSDKGPWYRFDRTSFAQLRRLTGAA